MLWNRSVERISFSNSSVFVNSITIYGVGVAKLQAYLAIVAGFSAKSNAQYLDDRIQGCFSASRYPHDGDALGDEGDFTRPGVELP